jgi:hypothetical protein
MATRYAFLARSARVAEVSDRDVLAALMSRDACAALLARIAASAAARRRARALVALLSQVATPACTWREGDLAVELFEEEGATNVRVMSEIGAGLREQILPVVTIGQPLDQLVTAFESVHETGTVLRLERVSSRCALLLASDEECAPRSTGFEISETSLAWSFGSAGAEDVDAGWDESAQTT